MELVVEGALLTYVSCVFFFFSSRRRHTRFDCDWSSDVCSSDLAACPSRGSSAPHSCACRGRGFQRRAPPHARGRRQALAPSAPVRDVQERASGSEERRVGEEGRFRWAPDHLKKKKNTLKEISAT